MTGVLCDRRINIKVKGRVYKTVVRPALKYGAETWPIKRVQEKKLDEVEVKMLRWMCRVAKMDRIKNERIRGTTKVVELSKKAQERRLQWYGHVMRRDETCRKEGDADGGAWWESKRKTKAKVDGCS
ncbi:uncharacterized protein [Macrobrachium rosenbergii]|uniref:uncharacterized protein n=1 Tax=Macrobrachium rosenbergii TaxID=79674 RepID=UPI0034D53BBE